MTQGDTHHYGSARVAAMRAVNLAPGRKLFAARLAEASKLLERFPTEVIGIDLPGGGFAPMMSMMGALMGHISPVHSAGQGADWQAVMHTGPGPSCDMCDRNGGFFGAIPPPRDSVTLLRCAGCYTAMYCSRACQSKAWKGHKTVCAASCVARDKRRAAILEAAAAADSEAAAAESTVTAAADAAATAAVMDSGAAAAASLTEA